MRTPDYVLYINCPLAGIIIISICALLIAYFHHAIFGFDFDFTASGQTSAQAPNVNTLQVQQLAELRAEHAGMKGELSSHNEKIIDRVDQIKDGLFSRSTEHINQYNIMIEIRDQLKTTNSMLLGVIGLLGGIAIFNTLQSNRRKIMTEDYANKQWGNMPQEVHQIKYMLEEEKEKERTTQIKTKDNP